MYVAWTMPPDVNGIVTVFSQWLVGWVRVPLDTVTQFVLSMDISILKSFEALKFKEGATLVRSFDLGTSLENLSFILKR